MDKKLLDDCLAYIDSYWERIIKKPSKNEPTNNPYSIQVPHAQISPNEEKFSYIFYWDTYFMSEGLLGTKHQWIIPEMVENFAFLFDTYHLIPNFTHIESLGRSQPPFFSSMVLDGYAVNNNMSWLKKYIGIAKKEYQEVWMDHLAYNHSIPTYGLNRYGGMDMGYAQQSEQESGWDMTSRFYNRCNEFLAIDLNCYLYKYELDFAKTAEILGDTNEQQYWTTIAKNRVKKMQLFWNPKKGFFYDYDYVAHQQSTFESLAGFVPLWAGIATIQQAKAMASKLSEFETDYGLTITSKDSLHPILDLSLFSSELQITLERILTPKQWDYPNIWPPLEYLSVVGLLRYGFYADAQRITKKSLNAHAKIFKKYHSLAEKVDGTTGDIPKSYWYPTQFGFGWTNAVIYRYTKLLDNLENNKSPVVGDRKCFLV